MYSIIVPVYNEALNIPELHQRLLDVTKKLSGNFEIIMVDDGSTDNTSKLLAELPSITVITLRKNFGQTAALDAGIKQAKGDVIVTLDGDLQNPPEEIPKLINYMQEHKYDVVSGWRKNRQDGFGKKISSYGALVLRKILLHDSIHDSGCTLKVYKKSCFEDVNLYGESHRFIPAILHLSGFSVGEIVVEHQARRAGQSKYGSGRIIRAFIDLLGLWFWRNYSYRPLHLFGGLGLILMSSGSILLFLLALARLVWQYPLSTSIWPMIAVLSILAGLQLFITGLIAEVLAKSYYSEGRKPYTIKTIVTNG
ncbi:MAG: glycosyltransferase family 2 protein [Patescibacteria group bacterium]|jgi:glycosyltransferase involved in cell wall biosynthesis